MYFRGFLIDSSAFFIDKKKACPRFTGISAEITGINPVYPPEKEGERYFFMAGRPGADRAGSGNYSYIKISHSSFYLSR